MASQSSNRRGLVWAVVGGIVLVVGIVAIIVATLAPRTSDASPRASQSTAAPSASSAPTTSAGVFVDSTVSARGWVPEPITTDADRYVRAALAAASTFDTQKSTRDAWLTYLDTWFTPDTRYSTEAERQSDMRQSQLEMRQGVVLPETDWDSLAGEHGRVTSAVKGPISYTKVPSDSTGQMRIATATVVLTYAQSTGDGGKYSYDDTARVSVQIMCGPDSVPTAHSARRAGDCKVVRFFSGSAEG